MANKYEIQATYDWMDDMFRRGLGPEADITAAYYNGNYSLSLQEAQTAKHLYMLDAINFKPGMRVLDIGCGWGPFLKTVRDMGGEGVGVTLSEAQVKATQKSGLDVYLQDWKDMTPSDWGGFDAIVSVGAFEHFASIDEFRSGQQMEVYRNFFRLCHALLPESGRLYVQTMVWDKMPDPDKASLDSPKGSDEYLLALLEKFYPGSWLPNGREQVVESAEGFDLIAFNSGKNDYIETMNAWGRETRKLTPSLLWGRAKLLPKFITDQNFRLQVESLRNEANKEMFKRGIMDHFRMTFEKAAA